MSTHHITYSGTIELAPLASSEEVTLHIAQGVQVALHDVGSERARQVWRIEAHKDSTVTYHWKSSDDKVMQHERVVDALCVGTGASVTVVCAQHTSGSQKMSLTTFQRHRASHTKSSVRIHGASADASRVSVVSTINIPDGLVAVSADQVHKHLLLDEKARVTSEPILEVSSDDVHCSHGAAIKNLDSAQLFYLQSRGYQPEQAREALINAFLSI